MARKARREILLIYIHDYVIIISYPIQCSSSSSSLDRFALALRGVFLVPWARSPRVNNKYLFCCNKIIGGLQPT